MDPVRYVFGRFVLDPRTSSVVRDDGREVRLQPKPYELLLLLLRAEGAVLSREALMRQLWPGVTVTEHSLRQSCQKLRDALGDDVIVTLPRRGIRLAIPVREQRAGAPVASALPVERTPLVGRDRERQVVAAAIEARNARVWQLHGPGGVGKTRLALAVARDQVGAWPGGVWFCDLADARGAADAAAALGLTLGLDPAPAAPVATVGRALRDAGPCLVVLDSFERSVAFAEDTLGRWLADAPEAHFLVTTREVLPGTVTLPVGPLDLATGVRLFEQRANAVAPHASAAWRPEVLRELVSALDGLPLAIELAAARVRVLTPEQIAGRLTERFRVLAHPEHGGRHGTLRATLDWSWELLGPVERSALAQLSVFEGGFALEAAEAVLALPEGVWPLDVVQSLVEKALVAVDGARLRLLRSIAAYAAEHLADDGGAAARHGRWYGRGGATIADRANVLLACRRASERGDGAVAVGTLRESARLLRVTGPLGDALPLVRAACALDLGPRERAAAELILAEVANSLGRYDEACASALRAREAFRDLDDTTGEALSLGEATHAHLESERRSEALATLDAAVALPVDSALRAQLLGRRGLLLAHFERHEEARAAYEESLAEGAGDPLHRAKILGNLGTTLGELREYSRAVEHLEAALALHAAAGNQVSVGKTHSNLAVVHMDAGRFAEARGALDAALVVHRAVGNRRSEGIALARVGSVERMRGSLEAAAGFASAALAIARELGHPDAEAQRLALLGEIAVDAGADAEARRWFELARERGHLPWVEAWLGMLDVRAGGPEGTTRAAGAVSASDHSWIVLEPLARAHAHAGDLQAARAAAARILAPGPRAFCEARLVAITER